MKFVLSISLFFCLLIGQAQQRFTISGSITDAKTGESLMGVNVFLQSNPQKGVVSNYYGYYALRLQAGTYTLVFSSLGYEQKEITVVLHKDVKRNHRMESIPLNTFANVK